MSIRKRTMPSGKVRWQVDYVDCHRKRRARQFMTKKDAVAFETQARAEVADRTHVARSAAITIMEAVGRYVRYCEVRVAAREMERRSLLDVRSKLAHVTGEHGIGAARLPDVSFTVADTMRLRLIGAGMSAANARKVIGTLRTLLNWCVDSRLVARNELAGRRAKRGTREKKQVAIPARADIARLLGEADDLPAPLGLYIRTATLTGCRAGELRGLTWADVDLSAGTIRIRQRAEQDGTIGLPKTAAGNRTVPLPAGLLNVLKEAFLAAGRDREAFLFASRAGGPLDHDTFSGRHWRPLLRRLGLTDLTFHGLRHYYASALLNSGVPLTEVSRRLGHAHPGITLAIYAHAMPEASVGAELTAIENALAPTQHRRDAEL